MTACVKPNNQSDSTNETNTLYGNNLLNGSNSKAVYAASMIADPDGNNVYFTVVGYDDEGGNICVLDNWIYFISDGHDHNYCIIAKKDGTIFKKYETWPLGKEVDPV